MNPRHAPIAARAEHRCEYCHAPESIFNFPFEVEHIIPPGRGGTNESSNLALACRSCNLHKGTVLSARDPETQTENPLFNPRRDLWDVHFQVEIDTGMIHGVTPIGRATIATLKLNNQTQIVARRQWMRLELFPPAW